jgi:hypothetical protein
MPDKSRLIKTVDGELVEVTGNLMPGLPPPRPTPKRYYTESEKLKLFTELRARQQGEGYADTWLRIAFNASVGHFPPAEWMRGEAGRAPTPRQMKEILNQMDRGEI